MSFEIPSLQEVRQSVETRFSDAIYGESGMLRVGVYKVVAAVVSAAIWMIFLACRKIWKNRFVSTCDVENLDGFGAEYGMPHKPAINAIGSVRITTDGTTTSTVTVPEGTVFVDGAGHEYRNTKTYQFAGNAFAFDIDIIALGPGEEYNQSVGAVLTFRDGAPAGINETVAVIASINGLAITGGYAVEVPVGNSVQVWGETPEEYRRRLLFRVQNPPLGGSAADYRRWAESFAFVTRAYVRENTPLVNAVSVICRNDHAVSMVLTSSQISEVYNYLSSDARRAICADVRVINVTPVVFDISASMIPYNQANKEAADAEFTRIFNALEPGQSISFSEVAASLKVATDAEAFNILSAKKNGSDVSSFSLNLDVESNVAEVSSYTANYRRA